MSKVFEKCILALYPLSLLQFLMVRKEFAFASLGGLEPKFMLRATQLLPMY